MVFPQTIKLQRLADKLAAMTELKEQQQQQQQQKEGDESSLDHRQPVATATAAAIVIKRDVVWEKLKKEIMQFVPELHYIGSADLIRSVYTAGIRDVEVLKSLAALSLTKSREANQNYNHHIMTLATQCLAQCSPVPVRKQSKLALIRTLMTLRSPLEVGWQLQEVVIEDTLRFITDREYVWEYLDHFDEILLWELRAITLMEMEHRGDRVAGYITKQAFRVERGLEISTHVVNAGIEGAGAKLKEVLEPDDQSLLADDESHAILAYSEKAKQATDSIRLSSRQALVQIQSTSAQGINTIANRIHDGAPINDSSRKTLADVGIIGAASVGAAALVADSLIESTGQVAKKTAAVTADVVEHKYGSKAGKLVRNASDTAGNIARTLGHVALLHKSRAMTKSVAKVTGKAHLRQQINEKCLLDEFASGGEDEEDELLSSFSSSSDGGKMFVAAHDDMFHEELLLVEDETAANSSLNVPEEEGSTNDDDDDDVSSHHDEEHPPSSASSSKLYDGDDVFILQDNDNLATDFDFCTTMSMSPSELDSCLPDQITSIDAQSDFFSDVTNEPLYERGTRSGGGDGLSFNLLKDSAAAAMGRNSIFRNLDNSQDESLSSIERDGVDVSCRKKPPQHKKLLFDDDDDNNSLGYTACTMEETYVTNSTLHDQQNSSLLLDHHRQDSQDSGFEKHYEAWTTGSEVGTEIPHHQNDKLYEANRIPPNGYVLSDGGVKPEVWSKDLYSSVKSKFGL